MLCGHNDFIIDHEGKTKVEVEDQDGYSYKIIRTEGGITKNFVAVIEINESDRGFKVIDGKITTRIKMASNGRIYNIIDGRDFPSRFALETEGEKKWYKVDNRGNATVFRR